MSLDLSLSVWVSAAVAVTIFGLVWVIISSVMSLTEKDDNRDRWGWGWEQGKLLMSKGHDEEVDD